MKIKAADDRRPQIRALTALLRKWEVPAPTRQRIELELRMIKAGERAEKEAAYQIEFYTERNPNVMTIHDLRLSVDGRVAQIDHLIITRLLELWVCESKHFGEGVEINQHGEWSAYYGGRGRGIPSPIEQNNRHIAVLRDAFAKGLVKLPTDLRSSLRFESLVLVSDSARIRRPETVAPHVQGLEGVVKADQLRSKISNSVEERLRSDNNKTVGTATIERIARELVALHSPANIDFAKKFGLADALHGRRAALGRIILDERRAAAKRRAPSARYCESCGDRVSEAVVEYCRDYAWLFENAVLCVDCQDDFYPYR